MEILTKLEELILLSVLKMGENAYGTTIYKYLQEVTGKKLSLGGVYFPLDRLTKRGVSALNEINRMNEVLWAGFADLARPSRR